MLKKNIIKVVDTIEDLVPKAKPVVIELLVAVAVLVTALLVCGFDAIAVGNLVGFLSPCHDTATSIKEPWPEAGSSAVGIRKRGMFRKLVYWLIFAGVMDAGTCVPVRPVPFYVFAKPAFFVWFYSSDVLTSVSARAWERLENAVDGGGDSDIEDFDRPSTSKALERHNDRWRRQKSWYYRFLFGGDDGCWAFDPPVAAAVVWAGLLLCGFDRTVIGNLIGFLYSCRTTVALFDAPRPKEGSSAAGIRRAESLDKLSWWLIFAGALFVEHNVGSLLRSIPYYMCIRTGILIWC